ncbi:SDR family oxidoreductase [Cytophaga hutchinsonii]|uniref:Possible oxidoreductase n=1 Tax=Cytophaga hutchinsonii (strain ATCC 33406 / DSM 1761 / CIP 103989 / NBRC 15051 / NCIMB 9469 / D465) TaxID=269798 RepID=A0A6N4ST96_CYTH3|nr:SDR family NAD(P)-dependent oxidoreductase [Cytophaga hutchinsonii]ABG59521.1 possible oxidoreductase [Cytophaga hutchinsonii ATCC 33406]SFX94732.1 uncharacterized oxidoreductase [Cytophaga hutchinsonii ATCC 33406]
MLTGNTIVITGGSSGVGLELARQLIAQKNTVIICGRSAQKLADAANQTPWLVTYTCNIADSISCQHFYNWIKNNYPACNILINNAAIAYTTDFLKDEQAIDKANEEFQTNVLAPIRLTKLFSPLLLQNEHPALINISTGLIYAPKAGYPFYTATKAALHIFTQTLRMQTAASPLKIIEALLPVVDTPWHKGRVPKSAISATQAAAKILSGIDKGQNEIRVSKVALLYWVARISPKWAITIINRL